MCRGDGAYIRDGVLSYAVWRETKCVTVMSTEFPGHPEHTVLRTVKSKLKDLNTVKENRMSHCLFRETIVRELCDIQVSVHQSAGAEKQANRQLVGAEKQAKPTNIPL